MNPTAELLKTYKNCGGINVKLSYTFLAVFILNKLTKSNKYENDDSFAVPLIKKNGEICWKSRTYLAKELLKFINEEILLYKLELLGQ